jgi:exodeoxyribonuclease-5
MYRRTYNDQTELYEQTLDTRAFEEKQLLVIDECSMVDEQIGADLLSFDIPILVLGDPFQLPPVEGAGFFTKGKPDYMLTEVHRQAEGGEIIRLATAVREGYYKPMAYQGPEVTIVRKRDASHFVYDSDIVICGMNKSRHAYNNLIRKRHGFLSPYPGAAEKVIGTRNGGECVNGVIYLVNSAKVLRKKDATGHPLVEMSISEPLPGETGRGFETTVHGGLFAGMSVGEILATAGKDALYETSEMAFGYAITCHKAQGSAWDSVTVFDESPAFKEHRDRWLYTAVTRAAKKLTLVI